ncbi:Imm50 family immunity protein [Pseudomonas monteilii]|uniref:Imm50 family immunity protein n=1 Tax=Pseudomonas monteilii TaxID=76759 RepID=UPI00383BA110
MECPTYISNTEKVTDALGYWPCFHDAEVISFSAARAAPGHAGKTSARLCVNVCQYKEVGVGTVDYDMVCCKSVLIEYLFTDLQFLSLEDFNHQNVINSIKFSRLEDLSIEVEFESIYGVGGIIRCMNVEVSDVTILL